MQRPLYRYSTFHNANGPDRVEIRIPIRTVEEKNMLYTTPNALANMVSKKLEVSKSAFANKHYRFYQFIMDKIGNKYSNYDIITHVTNEGDKDAFIFLLTKKNNILIKVFVDAVMNKTTGMLSGFAVTVDNLSENAATFKELCDYLIEITGAIESKPSGGRRTRHKRRHRKTKSRRSRK